MTGGRTPYFIVPRLAKAGWLVHGFGRAGWGEEDLRTSAALQDFRPVIMHQLHSDIVHRLGGVPSGKLEGDALMTDVPGLLLVIRTADCLPVFLVDESLRAVAAVHCGWRGTRARILERTVRKMTQAYGTDPADLLAALGPCIGSACYEVGPEVREAFWSAGFPEDVFDSIPSRPAKARLDLRRANAWLLLGLGVKTPNIWTADSCTHCDPDLLSFRRNKGEPRRMCNFIGIRPAAD
jgi:YfiH family protein